MRLALRIREADDEHVLGEPAFLARLPTGDAQSMAFLAEKRVAAVTRAEAFNAEFLREMHNETAGRIELADRMQTAHELAFTGNALKSRPAAACHDRHIEDDVGAVSDFHPTARIRGI